MSQEVVLDKLKRHEVDIASNIIQRNHPLGKISIFKALPFLEVITCRSLWKKDDPMPDVQGDERKLLKFQTLKENESNFKLHKRENAKNIKSKIVKVAAPIMSNLMQCSSDIAMKVQKQNTLMEEEEKKLDMGNLMSINPQRDDIEEDKNEDLGNMTFEHEQILSTPMLKKNPFLYFGFGINLYFDFLLTLIFTMVMV